MATATRACARTGRSVSGMPRVDVMTCRTCHAPDTPGTLLTLNAAAVGVDHAYQVCAQCHSEQRRGLGRWCARQACERVGGAARGLQLHGMPRPASASPRATVAGARRATSQRGGPTMIRLIDMVRQRAGLAPGASTPEWAARTPARPTLHAVLNQSLDRRQALGRIRPGCLPASVSRRPRAARSPAPRRAKRPTSTGRRTFRRTSA